MTRSLAAILLALALATCEAPSAPCVPGAPVLSERGDTLGHVCRNYRGGNMTPKRKMSNDAHLEGAGATEGLTFAPNGGHVPQKRRHAVVVSRDGQRWALSAPSRTSDGYLLAMGTLLDPETGEAAEDESGFPVLHSFFLGRAE